MESKTKEKTKSKNLVNIGKSIRATRMEKQFSQRSFAASVKLDPSYIGGVERGERNISALNLIKIAKALNVQVGDFFKGIE